MVNRLFGWFRDSSQVSKARFTPNETTELSLKKIKCVLRLTLWYESHHISSPFRQWRYLDTPHGIFCSKAPNLDKKAVHEVMLTCSIQGTTPILYNCLFQVLANISLLTCPKADKGRQQPGASWLPRMTESVSA